MKTYDIALIGGDGTGPEVAAEAVKVSEAAEKKFGFKINWHKYDFGGERYLKTGEVLPDSAVGELRFIDQGIKMIELLNGPGKSQLVGFCQMIIDGVHDHPYHSLVLIPQSLAHRRR